MHTVLPSLCVIILYNLIFIIIHVPSSKQKNLVTTHAFSHDTTQVDLRLIGQQVAWLQAAVSSQPFLPGTLKRIAPRNGQASRSAISARMANVPRSYLPCALGAMGRWAVHDFHCLPFWGGECLNCHSSAIKDVYCLFGGFSRALINQLVSHNGLTSRVSFKTGKPQEPSATAIFNAQDARGKVSGLHTG